MGTGKQKYTGVKAASESSIEITFTFQGKRCRERLKVKPTASSLKQAANHRAAIMHAIEIGTFDYSRTFPGSKNIKKVIQERSDAMLIKDYLEIWFEDKKLEYKSSTQIDYRRCIDNELIPAFGDLRLNELKRYHVKRWANSMSCSLKTIRNKISPLRKALDNAFHEDEILESNPLSGWSYKKNEPPKKEHVHPLSKQEQIALLNTLSGQKLNFIQFAIWSGLRTSEMIALRWGDIDWIRNEIIVTKALTRGSKQDEKPKTGAGIRRVKLFTYAKEALIKQKQYTFIEGDFIFHNPETGCRWNNSKNIRKFWKTALQRAGVSYRNPYQTRHTFASMMVSAGEPPMWVAQQMGHKDWMMIIRVYGKWMPDSNQSIGQKAEKIYSYSDANCSLL